MLKSPLVWSGVLLVLVGLVWLTQGLGALGGSPMTGETLWVVVGSGVAVVGAGMVAMGVRRARQ